MVATLQVATAMLAKLLGREPDLKWIHFFFVFFFLMAERRNGVPCGRSEPEPRYRVTVATVMRSPLS